MSEIYNKLVRDNIPDIIIANDEFPVTRILDDSEYKLELEKKLLEEYNEVLNTNNSVDRIEELADMLEIISSLAEIEGKSIDDVIDVMKSKREKRGGFSKKIYLETVSTIHKMNLQDLPFKLVNNGTKTIEMRVYDEKRRLIKVGDIIEFNNDNTDLIIKTKVINLHIFPSFKELYDSFDKVVIGYRKDEVARPSDMEQYYSFEKIKKYGVVGIEIEKIN